MYIFRVYVKLRIFLLSVAAINTQLSCAKKGEEKLSFTELKIENQKLSPTKIFWISVFNLRGCLASCLTFRPF